MLQRNYFDITFTVLMFGTSLLMSSLTQIRHKREKAIWMECQYNFNGNACLNNDSNKLGCKQEMRYQTVSLLITIKIWHTWLN